MAKAKCVHGKGSDYPCGAYPVRGATVCAAHGGMAPQVRTKAAVRAEVMAWGLGDAHTDPGEVLLRLVTQSAARAQRYASELEALVDESPSLREALIADIWVAPDNADAYKAGEYIRGLAQLEAAERDRCANFATKAIAAGLAERTVRLAEKQGALIADVLRAVLTDDALGLTAQQRKAAPDVIRTHLLAIAG